MFVFASVAIDYKLVPWTFTGVVPPHSHHHRLRACSVGILTDRFFYTSITIGYTHTPWAFLPVACPHLHCHRLRACAMGILAGCTSPPGVFRPRLHRRRLRACVVSIPGRRSSMPASRWVVNTSTPPSPPSMRRFHAALLTSFSPPYRLINDFS